MSFIFAIAEESKTDIFLLKLKAPAVSILFYLSKFLVACAVEFNNNLLASLEAI
jgi:hypothetical protein